MNIKRTRHIFQANPEIVNQDIVTTGIKATVDPNTGDIKDIEKNVNGNKFLDTYAATPLPFYGDSHTEKGQKDIVNNKLSFLDRKLTATRKTITALDSYHIIGEAKTLTDVYACINSLLPNTSFIVNTPDTVSYTLNNTNYQFKKGDLIYKGLDNNFIYVPALASGYYYPSKFEQIENGNTYTLTYSFTSNPPKEGTTVIGSGEYQNLQKSDIVIEAENPLYHAHKQLGPKDVDTDIIVQKYNQTKNIQPVVYYYYNNERIMFDKDFEITAKDQVRLENFSSLIVDVEVR